MPTFGETWEFLILGATHIDLSWYQKKNNDGLYPASLPVFQLCYFIKWNNNPLICFLLQCKITPSIMLFLSNLNVYVYRANPIFIQFYDLNNLI